MFEKELKDKGFTIVDNKITYEFSDFEVLEATISEHTKVNKDKCLKIENLRMHDYFNNLDYFNINYALYYDKIDDFFALLRLLGYDINKY